MALKYLNFAGLSTLVSDIKTWVLARIPTKTSEITNDSGFITSSSLPTVNNATLTIQKNGTNVQTFTANASSNKTANITVPTKTSELTNDSGFLTSHQSLGNYVTLTSDQTLASTKSFTTNINTANVPTSQKETWRIIFNKNSADTDSTTAAAIGVVQFANTHDFIATLRLANPRANNKPVSGNTKNCWSGIGVYYNYDENKGYPHAANCWDWPASSNSTNELASTSWVRTYCETTKGFLTSHQSLSNYSTLANTIKSLSISGRTITYTKGDNTTGTLTTQDNNTWTAMVGATSSANGSVGYVNAVPPKDGYNTKYLRADGTWAVPPDHTYTVNNATLTIQKNGTNVATFTSNASSNATANITVPTKVSELTNDSGYLTSHQSLSNYVTLNGTQTITGSKDFSSNSYVTVREYRFIVKNDSMVLGTTPSSNQWTGFSFTGKDGTLISEIVQSFQKNGNSLYQINVFPNEANSEKRSVIAWAYNSATGVNHTSFTSAVIPQSTNVYDLGTSTNQWKSVHATTFTGNLTGNVTGNCSGSSASCTGNAATATQFSANKNVTLTGYVNGTASSKAGWSIATALKNCYFYTGRTVTNTYFKVASGILTGGWNRYETLIRFVETTGNASCTLRIYMQLDGSALFDAGYVTVLDSVNFGTNTFNVVYKNDTNKTLFEIYYQLTPKNHQVNALVLYETERKLVNSCDILTMYNDSTPVASLPSDYTLLTTEFELYCGDLVPAGNNKNLGSSDAKWSNAYATTFIGNLTGNVTGNVSGNCSGSSGSCTGNAATATKATNNANGKELTNTIVKGLSISGKTITYTQIDGNTGTLTTQDTVYTHPTSAGNKHIPSGGSADQYLKYSASGTAVWADLIPIFSNKVYEWHDTVTVSAMYSSSEWTAVTGGYQYTANISLGRTQLSRIYLYLTTEENDLVKVVINNGYVFGAKNCVDNGKNSIKADTTTYGNILTQTVTGSNRLNCLFCAYNTTVTLTITYTANAHAEGANPSLSGVISIFQ